MARAHEPKHKISRRFGVDIYGTGGDSLQRRLSVPPGGMKLRRRKQTDYGTQLFEKQKAKAFYGVREAQFRRYFEEAERESGNAAENLLRLLERRLDNVVYRLGFARTRPMARQMVNHGHVIVRGRKTDIPSYLVKPGDTIALDQTAAAMPVVIEELESRRPTPAWLDRQGTTGRVIRLPMGDEINMPINPQAIIAFYSR